MASSDDRIGTLNIASYNLRGLNQGRHFLDELMKTHDIILIQEHWLSSIDLNKLSCLNSRFMCFASSAVDQKVSQNVLVGRPFGGVGILYDQHKIKNVKCIFKDSRSLIVAIGQIIIVNIYLPNCIIKDIIYSNYKIFLRTLGMLLIIMQALRLLLLATLISNLNIVMLVINFLTSL